MAGEAWAGPFPGLPVKLRKRVRAARESAPASFSEVGAASWRRSLPAQRSCLLPPRQRGESGTAAPSSHSAGV
jgi:hypothetical protein